MKSTCWDTRATDSIIKSDQKDTEGSILTNRLLFYDVMKDEYKYINININKYQKNIFLEFGLVVTEELKVDSDVTDERIRIRHITKCLIFVSKKTYCC